MSTTSSLRLKCSATEARSEIAASNRSRSRGRGRFGRKVSRTRAIREKYSSWYSFTTGLPSRPHERQWILRSGSPSRYSRVPTNSSESPTSEARGMPPGW